VVVVDCANGAASRGAPAVLSRLGAWVEVIAAEPDGTNINEACGSTHPEALQEAVVRLGADSAWRSTVTPTACWRSTATGRSSTATS
jgi:phosphomannomutase